MFERVRVLSKDQKVEICELYKTGDYTHKQLAIKFNIAPSSICNHLKRRGFMGNRIITDNIKNSIVETYRTFDLTYKEIAKKYNIRPNTVRYILKDNGIKLDTFTEAMRKSRKYTINENYFDQIDTEEKAYFLGFLYADGYNSEERGCIKLSLKYTDKYILEKFNKLIESNRPLQLIKSKTSKYSNGKQYTQKDQYCLNISNRHISKKLAELGCTQGKTFNIIFPEWLEKDLQKHFIRGYFDGDGSVWRNKNQTNFEIIGTENFISSIRSILMSELKFSMTKLHKRKGKGDDYNIVWFRSGGNKKALKLKEFLYKDSSIYLDRKYQIFNNIYN